MEVVIIAIIYKITNDINGKIYVGQTSYSLEKRFKEHCRDSQKHTSEVRPLYRAMQKYGIENFHIELIEETDNPSEREMYWIEKFNSYGDGNYNATKGGDGKVLYDHKKILFRLKEFPYPMEVSKEFGCSADIVRNIAKSNGITILNSGHRNVNSEKEICQYTKTGEYLTTFSSVSRAAEWCFENKKCVTLNSGVRSHIADVANGKRKSAYGYIWRYNC